MLVRTLKTDPIRPGNSLLTILDQAVSELPEHSIVVITSKIVSICQGRIVPFGQAEKNDLIHREAECYIPADENKYGITLSVKDGILIPSAGIDESNGEGCYILWPEAPQKVANSIRTHLLKRFNLNQIGVIITDSKTTALRRGTTGVAVAHSGFKAVNDYVGQPDIFGRKLRVTQANIMDGIAAAAVLVMGEGNEQTPLAVVTDVPFVQFQDRDPSAQELEYLRIPIEEDLYEPLLNSEKWVLGGK